jgi:hypothetical protein
VLEVPPGRAPPLLFPSITTAADAAELRGSSRKAPLSPKPGSTKFGVKTHFPEFPRTTSSWLGLRSEANPLARTVRNLAQRGRVFHP